MFRRLFLPSVIFSTGWALSDIVDSVVVGQKLGTTGLAAMGMVLPIYMIDAALAHGFGMGGSVRFSKLLAHGDSAAANRSFRQTVFTALAITVAAAVAGLCSGRRGRARRWRKRRGTTQRSWWRKCRCSAWRTS